MFYKREIPRLNKNNFSAWQGLMKLHLVTIGDTGLKYLDEKYEEPSSTLSVNDIVENENGVTERGGVNQLPQKLFPQVP